MISYRKTFDFSFWRADRAFDAFLAELTGRSSPVSISAAAFVADQEISEIAEFLVELPDLVPGTGQLIKVGTNETITGGNEASLIAGDVLLMEETSPLEPGDGGRHRYKFGNDTISGDRNAGGGDDLISGDVYDFSVSVIYELPRGGTDVPNSSIYFQFGDDMLDGMDGNDILTGDIYDPSFSLGVEFDLNIHDDPLDAMNGETILFFGDDILFGGNGADNLSGDTVGGYFATNLPALFSFGDDGLYGGADGDRLFGDIGDAHFMSELTGYWGIGFQGYLENTRINVIYSYVFPSYSQRYEFGDDLLDSGSGADLLIGDGGALEIDYGWTDIYTEHFFGHDTLLGGSDNDILFGDVAGLSIGAPWYYSDGNAVAEQNHTYLYYGSDTIVGGSGDDKMWGDYEASDEFLDKLPADASHVTQVGGQDVFVFDIGSGNDEIWDFRRNEDTLDLRGYGYDDVYNIVWSWQGDNILIDLDGTSEDIASILIIGGDIYYSDILI